jgi:3-dehydroquinate synthase
VGELPDVPRRVELGRDFSDVYQGNGCRHALLGLLSESGQRLVVISDRQVEKALRPHFGGGSQEWLVVEPGETSKCLNVAANLWSQLCALGADRATAILAVGGGMVGDLAGFVASTYLRGLPFYSLPTSLLAMVDASVGGKVGIDLAEGKNLVGQFYPARAVAIDPELLDSLPDSEWASGMAEVIKHGILQGAPLWDTLLDCPRDGLDDPAHRERMLREAVEVKLRVVAQDPYERTGLRATLNLGHTFGHAFEWCSSYELRHGEAVALGLLAAVRLSRSLAMLEKDFEHELLSLLERWSLPTVLPQPEHPQWDWAAIKRAFDRDKKSSAGSWNFILPARVGEVVTVRAPDPCLVKAAVDSLKAPPPEAAS